MLQPYYSSRLPRSSRGKLPVSRCRALARFVLLLALLGATLPAAQAKVFYVDAAQPGNEGDGRSWSTAKKDLQEALNLATTVGDEVWVKAGTYLPTAVPPLAATNTTATTVQDRTFYLLGANIKLYGGFAGTETAASQRNPVANPTTLSGDLDGSAGTADAYHVLVTINRTSACVLDGFVVRGGRATGTGSIMVQTNAGAAVGINRINGGGLLNNNSNLTVSNCTFSANRATNGGGINNYLNSPTISGCTFSDNSATNGGGINDDNSNPTISNCTFSANSATNGGGISNYNTSSPVVSGCTFSANSATSGGGMLNNGSSPTVSGCTFGGNSASSGGAMYNLNSSPVVSSSAFSSNSAAIHGGGLYNTTGSPELSNCVFHGNSAGANGGALHNNATGSPVVSSCTFYGNTATGGSSIGGGLYYVGNAGGSLTNCILHLNTTPSNGGDANREEIYKAGTGAGLSVSYCLVRDAAGVAPNLGVTNASLSNCFRTIPALADPTDPDGPDNQWRTADDGLRPTCTSFVNDKGTGSTPATDILGNPRKGPMDLGAYEATGGTSASTSLPTDYTSVNIAQTAAALRYTDCQNELLQLNAASPYTLLGSTTVAVRVLATAATFYGRPYVRRYYDISPLTNPSTATAEVTLYFSQADFADYNAVRGSRPALPLSAADPEGYAANLRISQHHGASASGAPGSYSGWAGTGPAIVLITPTAVSYNATAARWEARFPVTGFSGFFAHTSETPLPVVLTAFTARAVKAGAELTWHTASEQNSARFDIERSRDGQHFEKIGEEQARGNSAHLTIYSLLDKQLPAGTIYYRLRQVDRDGSASYSPVRTLTATTPPAAPTGTLLVLPTVAAPGQPQHYAYTGPALPADATLEILDATGRCRGRQAVGPANRGLLAPAGLVPGWYWLRLRDAASVRPVRFYQP
ncbi:right-handed parallel beta-helix repeat-containing protein [Hymenobacter sp. ASUV-10]|uniref:Right-handed parallel beta-helix repeat-containing protein n=1 Tax=Hymenobacter aranciens TaxID=3063996 RepID=A0ABT9BID9_9BACT|nr:right-handed parallel beta-helix repeat-containing protein [Hymenobacter sp. ASUV-10]MDO7877570.1 right-handed parallel beta-helix repeat-containing protein [Hymenobacter sp. ASUV-10]